MIPLPVLQEIIKDTILDTQSLKRIGVTGSYARGDFNERSDIDLVFDTGNLLMDESTIKAGISIKSILGDQFGHNVDVIMYSTILTKTEQMNSEETLKGRLLALHGYKQMLDDLKWIWRVEE